MKITRYVPEPPPTFTMEFTQDEGWGIVMALKDAHDNYQEAIARKQWREWADELDRELRR